MGGINFLLLIFIKSLWRVSRRVNKWNMKGSFEWHKNVLRSGGFEVLSVAMLGTGKGSSSQATGGAT